MNDKPYRVLIVDDEVPMRKLIEWYLQHDQYETKAVSRGEEALDWLRRESFDVVLLDIMMPGMDGWEVCERIRTFSRVPIIMLSARDHTLDKVKGLRLGADDYLTKPFEELELLARLEALLRRSHGEKRKVSSGHGIVINQDTHTVSYEGQPIELTPKEFELLHTFMSNIGRGYSREQLLKLIWGQDYEGDDRTVDSHVKNLREKLRRSGIDVNAVIKTVWGIGYKGV